MPPITPQGDFTVDEWVQLSLERTLGNDEWKNVSVVGFGECTHGTEDHFAMQAAGARHMIQHQGARVVVLEDSELEVKRLLAVAEVRPAFCDEYRPIGESVKALEGELWSEFLGGKPATPEKVQHVRKAADAIGPLLTQLKHNYPPDSLVAAERCLFELAGDATAAELITNRHALRSPADLPRTLHNFRG